MDLSGPVRGHEGRLRALVQGPGAGPDSLSDLWLLESCQPCPQCLTLVRREAWKLEIRVVLRSIPRIRMGFSMFFARVLSRLRSF